MNLAVIGSGYVGLVAGACLADAGNNVTCVDVDREKIARLRRGEIPIYEPGLESLISRNLAAERLRFTTDAGQGVQNADIVFIAVGTPPGADGFADLESVCSAAAMIARHLAPNTVVVTKSTVPVGTGRILRAEIEGLTDAPFHLCSNPEFLREGDAVADFMHPDRVVCGVESERSRRLMEELYAPFVGDGHPLIFMDVRSAELTKYAANSMLAARVSLMNQFAELCEATGADIEQVRKGIGADSRIGPAFLRAGAGYGGSCLPKDVEAIIRSAGRRNVDLGILRAVHEANERQKTLLARKVLRRFGDDLSGFSFALWGLAFKPETDDMRAAPSRVIVAELRDRGASIKAHDPVALEKARGIDLGARVEYASDAYEALQGADALILATEWRQYRRPDWEKVKERLSGPIVFDGRNFYDPDRMEGMGFEYYPIGRRVVGPRSVA